MRPETTTRLAAFVDFQKTFVRYALHIRETLFGNVLLIVVGGLGISRLEDIPVGDAIYFAFVTGLTIGYGDIHPVTPGGRVLSIGLGLAGLIFTGLTVGVATRALADTVKKYDAEPEP